MSSRDLPNPTGPLSIGDPQPYGLSLLLAEAELSGHINGLRLGWLQGLKTGLLFGVVVGVAFALVVSCGARS